MIKTGTLEGKEHWIVPIVLLRTGIYSGSAGGVYYPPEVLQASAHAWGGRPIVVDHPKLGNKPVSALDPGVLSRIRIGTLFNVKFDGEALRGEGWLDKERTGIVDHRVRAAVLGRQRLPVSTGMGFEIGGFWTDAAGNIAPAVKSLSPDHLAILVDQEGACSLAQGCGLLVGY